MAYYENLLLIQQRTQKQLQHNLKAIAAEKTTGKPLAHLAEKRLTAPVENQAIPLSAIY